MTKRRGRVSNAWPFGTWGGLLAAVLLAVVPGIVQADDKQDADQLVQKAKLTVDSFAADK